MSTIISKFAVRNNDGSVDQPATVSKFQSELSAYVAESETEASTIESAVEAALSEKTSLRLDTDYLASQATVRLNTSNDNHKAMVRKVRAFITANSTDLDDSGSPVNPEARYHVSRGPGGGTCRLQEALDARAAKASAKAAKSAK